MPESSTSLPVRTIGIDLGDHKSTFCVLDQDGAILEEGSVPTERRRLEEIFGAMPAGRVVIEASAQSSWISRCLTEVGHEVVVANPRQVHLISKNDRKSDRNDARLLARLGRVDVELLRPVTHRSERAGAVRTLLLARKSLVSTRTRLVNMIRAETKVVGERIPTCSAASFHRQARPHLPETLRAALEPLLDVLSDIQKRIVGYDKEIGRLADQDFPETGVLRQVRGVGPLIALAFVVTIDDPKRFARSRTVGAFLGLTPRSYQSGDRAPQLRISKRGDSELRHLLVTAATHLLRRSSPDCDLKRYGRRIARGGSLRDRATARVAVARKLAVLLHRLWLTGEVYEPLRSANRVA